ncbi:hypothetical protein MVEN_01903600 [Mycena venus]|uniref:DUF6589 domain-containing protein n=1 Tax=Mycena venus TaxID=2733690 RepID=A0A8H7CLM3_9AGAR|nr:hypothetical protein MVEN_01903600 [Mycena venus]
MRDDRPATDFQPLGTNGDCSTERHGMENGVCDFNRQEGVDPEKDTGLLEWIGGDGASYGNLLALAKLCAPLKDKFINKVTTPEIWHTGATDLNSISSNHYGPATSSDPSSLSKCSNAAGLKRPSNIKSCDYYPTMRNLTLIWTAHVLDCWRIFFGVDDLRKYFQDLAKSNKLPTLSTLLEHAELLTDRYASQAAIEHALDVSEATNTEYFNRVPEGRPWVPPRQTTMRTAPEPEDAEDTEMPGLDEIREPNDGEEIPEQHEEKPEFTGDRVLRNSEIFMMEFGWWLEMVTAVPEGDIGRVWEIFKIWIFKFAGSSHQNYMAYLLEVYCFLRYETSKDLNNAILNNWLVNVTGELGKYLPRDLHQEHYNRWFKDMIRKHGGEWDSHFFRHTISPNVHHFLRIKEEITAAFDLGRRSKTHTSPHLRDELGLLLTMFKEQEVHYFRSGRSMGHAAVNQFARGCRRLEEGKLDEWLNKSTCFGDFLQEIRRQNDGAGAMASLQNENSPPSNESEHGSGLRSNSPAASVSDSHSSVRSNSPAASASGSDLPCPSSGSESGSRSARSADGSGSIRSADSSASARSFYSIMSGPDPNEPDDDGDDRTGCKLASGSYTAAYIDQDTGCLAYDDGQDVSDDENDAEPPQLQSHEGEDEEYHTYYHVDTMPDDDNTEQ